ncbi:MAG: dTDP-4-dehydrorhamnose reductase [Proteobacteria bacterium]|nr:dTDP-4-dehydrorhamnose reductase [Pseudomonadota bacterium]
MKILVTGSGGMLAKQIIQYFKSEKVDVIGLKKEELNITNTIQLKEKINQYNPDLIINCAGYTKVDMAELEKDRAFALNALAPYHLSDICRKNNIFLVHISTDYIFSGEKKEPYHPFDSPNPVNYYGITKLYGEHYIINSGCDYLIVRTSWLYGPEGNNFLTKILSSSEEKEEIEVVNDQYGAPTSTFTVAKYLLKLIEKEAHGIFHITERAGNGISWYTFAEKIIEVFDRKLKIIPVSTKNSIKRPAKRPEYSTLDISATEYFLGEKLPFWEVSLGDLRNYMRI